MSECLWSSQSGYECLGSSQSGYECLGSSQSGYEYLGSSQSGYECLGSSQSGYECLGSSQSGYECLGSSQSGYECLGSSQSGYECLGSSQSGYECLGSSQSGYECLGSSQSGYECLGSSQSGLGSSQSGYECLGSSQSGYECLGSSQSGYLSPAPLPRYCRQFRNVYLHGHLLGINILNYSTALLTPFQSETIAFSFSFRCLGLVVGRLLRSFHQVETCVRLLCDAVVILSCCVLHYKQGTTETVFTSVQYLCSAYRLLLFLPSVLLCAARLLWPCV